ncbi:MAG: DUF58 domain-containing protein [Eubacterium sp.]|nr:DUF58 domain-containing protein [Eubacterium sp.]
MKREKKVHIRAFRCISYVVLCLAVFFFFAFLRSYFLLVLAVLLVIWPMASAAGVLYLARKIQADMGSGQGRVCPGDSVLITFRLRNPAWWLSLDAEWDVCFENTFWEEQSVQSVNMPVRLHGEESLILPLQISDLGHFRISGRFLAVRDIMGLIQVRIPLALQEEICVIPSGQPVRPEQTEGYMTGLSETEESTERGSDFAEVSEIREYVPGDRIRDIHWKLSAKKDILMVKERISMAGNEMVLVLNPGGEKKTAGKVLTEAFHLGQAFVEQCVPVRLILWNQRLFGWDENRFSTMEEMEESFCRIYDIPLSMRNNQEWEQHMANCYPYLGAYLLVSAEEGEVQVVLHENA